ncbi:MAG: ATP-binding protein, partial [Chloroflexi bacterium]|nr:ATP-binding protein [Chloroflexota bacterium]
DLQELSRVEARAYKLDLVTVAVADLVKAALKRFGRQYEEKGVALTSSLLPTLPPIRVDTDRTGQVLINLIGNAMQYTPEGGSVNISAEQKGNEVYVSVKDNGLGIPPEYLPHIFDRFYRVDKSRSRRTGGGSGIGLTIAKSLVEAHGGKIWATSDGNEKGSAFIFTIPIG